MERISVLNSPIGRRIRLLGLTLALCGGLAHGPARAAAIIDLGTISGGLSSIAYGVSADGSVAVGDAGTPAGSAGFRWTLASGSMQSLGTLAGGVTSTAFGASGDGSVVVGESDSSGGTRAFRWTAASGTIQSLGTLPGGSFSTAAAVSADGVVVVGSGDAGGPALATIWDSTDGLRSLQTVLAASGAAGIGDWTSLDGATAVAGTSGTYAVVGYGTISGEVRGFLATGIVAVPEPSSLAAAGTVIICLTVAWRAGPRTRPARRGPPSTSPVREPG